MDKKAILVISSGTVNEKARRENIEAVEKEIKKNFAEYEVRLAFSSQKIINKIISRYGIYIDKPEEALNKLIQENFDEVVIQPINIIPGDEYENIKNTAEKFNFKKLIIGTPLLYNYNDYDKVIEAVKFQIPKLKENTAVILMGHGTTHSSDDCYSVLQDFIDKQKLNIFVGTLKGSLGILKLVEKLKENNIKEVLLTPLMLVAGNHAIEDMASDKDTSWKTILEREGIKTEVYLHGLGENAEIQKLYIEKLKALL